MPAADHTWRHDVIWAVIFALAALVLRLDSLRGVPAWLDWLSALTLTLALAGVAGLFARGAALRLERWLWRRTKMAEPLFPVPPHEVPPQATVVLPLPLTSEWRPLWVRILLSPIFLAGRVFALGCVFCTVYWALIILMPLVNPELVYHPVLRLRFFYLYAIMPVFPFGVCGSPSSG